MEIQLDVAYLQKQNIHFCLPCYGGQLTEQTFMGFMKWANSANELGIKWTVETLVNESLITRGRNTLVAKFLNNPNSTHLFFIDSDIGWEPWHALAMIMRDHDIIGGLYPMKTLPIKWVVNGFENSDKSEDGFIMEVSKTGTGFLCIKRNVFEKMKEHPAVKPYTNDIGLDPALNQHMKTYFDTAVREDRYYSEDWTFCENWRDLGGKVWVDTRVLLKHQGSFNFCVEQDTAIREAMKTSVSPINVLDPVEVKTIAELNVSTPTIKPVVKKATNQKSSKHKKK